MSDRRPARGSRRVRHLRRTAAPVAAFATAALLIAGCTASTTPAPSPSVPAATPIAPVGSAVSSSSSTPSPGATPAPTTSIAASPLATPAAPTGVPASPTPAPRAWVAAGSLPIDVFDGPVVALRDGGALAIARDGSAVARWDPSTSGWTKGAGLPTPRWNFAAVTLRDGRVLVAGGSNDRQQAYSSAYVYDPTTPGGRWTKAGLMSIARSAPAAALLQDGRVLIAGGAFFDRPGAGVAPDATGTPGAQLFGAVTGGPPGQGAAILAAYMPGTSAPGTGRRVNDIAPSRTVPALATAEVFDPATATFRPTGSMRFARAGAAAATLSDGRVLIVSPGGELWVGGDTGASQDARATATPETYDPATGRWTLTTPLPAIDRSRVAADGVVLPATDPWMTSTGALVAGPEGSALLVGRDTSWKHEADVVRTFVFEGGTGWREALPTWAGVNDWHSGAWRATPGIDLSGAFAANLPDGRVLIAGGMEPDPALGMKATAATRVMSVPSGRWADWTPMPTPRQGGRTATLADGSALLVGGDWSDSGGETAIRYVP